jgi:hypothetical protein
MDGVIKDPNLAPNHSFRHYLKSELLARDVTERISDAITGHKTPGIGRKYEHVEMLKKFEAISKLPVIPLAALCEDITEQTMKYSVDSPAEVLLHGEKF